MFSVNGRDVGWLTDEYHLFRVFFLVFLCGFLGFSCGVVLLYLVYRFHIFPFPVVHIREIDSKCPMYVYRVRSMNFMVT